MSDISAAPPLEVFDPTATAEAGISQVSTTSAGGAPCHDPPDAAHLRLQSHINNGSAHLQFFDDGTTAFAIPSEDGDAYEFFPLDEKGEHEAVRQEILAELEEEARAMMEEEREICGPWPSDVR
jgi:hypothetical protein